MTWAELLAVSSAPENALMRDFATGEMYGDFAGRMAAARRESLRRQRERRRREGIIRSAFCPP